MILNVMTGSALVVIAVEVSVVTVLTMAQGKLGHCIAVPKRFPQCPLSLLCDLEFNATAKSTDRLNVGHINEGDWVISKVVN